jgi:hypothetical protein
MNPIAIPHGVCRRSKRRVVWRFAPNATPHGFTNFETTHIFEKSENKYKNKKIAHL